MSTFAYTDGTTFFLAVDAAQLEDKQLAGLGKKVWRGIDGSMSWLAKAGVKILPYFNYILIIF